MSATSGEHDDEEDGGRKDGVGVPLLIVDSGAPTESQADITLAKGVLPSVEEVSVIFHEVLRIESVIFSDRPSGCFGAVFTLY